jgi:hypothetical protein
MPAIHCCAYAPFVQKILGLCLQQTIFLPGGRSPYLMKARLKRRRGQRDMRVQRRVQFERLRLA